MARTIIQTKKENQRSEGLPMYLYRILPEWNSPTWYDSTRWRNIVRNQPIAMICRDTLISNILYLDWAITPRDTSTKKEYEKDVNHYTKLLENSGWIDYSGLVELVAQDLLDLPFGGAIEVGRMGDKTEGRVEWLKNLDGATLYPTLDLDYPVVQKSPYNATKIISFPDHAVARTYLTPRPEIEREGWGMAPPEKIYLALELLWRGDQYYANLLLDTPQAGILDLGDMEKTTAKEWVEGFRELMSGVNAFKIPVLYEHNSQVKWIPFTKPPTEIMFDGITTKYASIVAAGYGLTLSDIGFTASGNGGETLSGTIRSERKTRRTGLAVLKQKLRSFFNSLLPPYLEFKWVDYEEELNVSLGRARLSNATAFEMLVKNRVITAEEARLQAKADGLITVPIPDELPESKLYDEIDTGASTAKRPGTLGDPVNPSLGGHGEVTNKMITKIAQNEIRDFLQNKLNALGNKIVDGFKEDYKKIYSFLANDMETLMSSNTKRASINQKRLEEHLNSYPWWRLSLDANEREALYQLYLDVYTESAIEQQKEFYAYLVALGYDIPEDFSNFDLKNPSVITAIRMLTNELEVALNQGTQFYLAESISSVFYDLAFSPEADKLYNADKSTDEIFNDPRIIDMALAVFATWLFDKINSRVDTTTDYEIGVTDRMAKFDVISMVGLRQKHWIVTSEEPCVEFCIPNENLGWVDMEYQYDGAFGKILHPLAHPHCMCDIIYQKSELEELAKADNFEFWYGD